MLVHFSRVGLVILLVACGTASEPSSETSAAISTTDWSLLGNGQCLAALQAFYPKKFGVSLPVARGSTTGDCAGEGACHLWLDDIPSSATWERIPNDARHAPAPYDLIVYPPVGKNPYGHVASVDHVDASGIWVMDANWNGDERRSTTPHLTPGYTAYGWYHLRSQTRADDVRNDVSCGELAREKNWGDGAACEWNGNFACGGHGTITWDCAHCCLP